MKAAVNMIFMVFMTGMYDFNCMGKFGWETLASLANHLPIFMYQ